MVILTKQLTSILKLSKLPKQIKEKDRSYLLLTLADLSQQGFSIQQSLDYLKVLLPKYVPILDAIEMKFLQGLSFAQAIKEYGFPLSQVAQLFYADKQGRFSQALVEVGREIEANHRRKAEIIKLLAYPALLSLFMTGLLFGIRTFMLPQILSFVSPQAYETNFWVQVLVNFFTFLPQIFLVIVISILSLYLLIDFWLLKLDILRRYQLLVHWPLCQRWVRAYCGYKFTKHLALFYEAGYSIQQALQFINKYPIDPLMTSIAQELQTGYLGGQALDQMIGDLGIFPSDLSLVILRGELTSQLGHQCRIYSIKIYQDLVEDFRRKISLIQPILFLLIALLVMSMYLMMMLPMLTMQGI